MNTIYLDSLMALNFLIDYLLLLSAGRICALPLRRWRIALGALFGSIYAALSALFPHIFAIFALKLSVGCGMVAIAYGIPQIYPRIVIVFLAVSAAFAGAVYAALGLAGGNRIGQFIPVSTHVLVLSFALCYAAVHLVFRHMGQKALRKSYTAELLWAGQKLCFTALADTGNELTDPISGQRILIVQQDILLSLFPALPADPFQAMETLSERYPSRFRLLSCSCVADSAALLLCFRPDALFIDGKKLNKPLVAISQNNLSPNGEYQAIF